MGLGTSRGRLLTSVICAACGVVRQGKIKSLEQIYLFSMPVKEYQIVEYFLGSALKDEVMKIMPVQKQTRAGQRTRFKVGLGQLCSAAWAASPPLHACMRRLVHAVAHPAAGVRHAAMSSPVRSFHAWACAG